MKKALDAAIGVILALVFPAWMLGRFWGPLEDVMDTHPFLGLVFWGLAWVCLMAGLSLLARALVRTDESSPESVDEGDLGA